MYSISLEPETDTPEVLKHYAESYQVKPGWYFLTGDPQETELLRRKLGFSHPNPKIDADKTQHAARVVYGNDALGRWGAMPGLFSPDQIVSSVRRLNRKTN
jgi:protein SCO1/2